MRTCPYCLTGFVPMARGTRGIYCSLRCERRAEKEEVREGEQALDGLFRPVQGGLMKIDLDLAENGLPQEA